MSAHFGWEPFFVGRTNSGHETRLCSRHREQLATRFEYDDERDFEPYEWRELGADELRGRDGLTRIQRGPTS